MKSCIRKNEWGKRVFGLCLGLYFLALLVLQTYLIFHHNPRIQPLLLSLGLAGLGLLFYFIRSDKSRVSKIYIYFSIFFMTIAVLQVYLLFYYISEIQLIVGLIFLIGVNLLLIFLIVEYFFLSENHKPNKV